MMSDEERRHLYAMARRHGHIRNGRLISDVSVETEAKIALLCVIASVVVYLIVAEFWL
jgi:hypothetical protein